MSEIPPPKKVLAFPPTVDYRSRITEGDDMPEMTDFDDRCKFEISGVFRGVRRTFWRSYREDAEELKAVLIAAGFDGIVVSPA